MDWMTSTLRHNPELVIFLTLALGFLIGRVRFGTFTLGNVVGTLLAGVVVGQLDIPIHPLVKVVLTIASATYEVTADVVESDIAAMSVGQEATVAVDAIDATIGGTVSAVAPSAVAGNSGVVSFPVTVALTGAPSALRAGMTADITIVTASATDVLTIPSEALHGTAGSFRVQVLGADGIPVTRDVSVGLVTNTMAEVTSGLTEGEAVVTGTASDQLAGSSSGGRFGAGGGAVMVEGGPTLAAAFLEAGLSDRLALFLAPAVLGQGVGWSPARGSTRRGHVTSCPAAGSRPSSRRPAARS